MEVSRVQTRRPPAKKKGVPYYLTRRDQRILHFLWKWKVASTATVFEAVVRGESTEYSTYKVLERLEKNGYVECAFNELDHFWVWHLTEKGFEAIKIDLGDLEEDGYLSENHRHDRHVLACHLGEWIGRYPERVLFFTEQDLRRRPKATYPDWVPRSKDHKADGYTRVVGPKKAVTWALEVELSKKAPERYESILQFYHAHRVVDRVIWVVPDQEIKATILRAKDCIKDKSENLHLFVDLGEYMKLGLAAKAINERSETLFTLREMYRGILGDFYGDLLGNPREHNRVTVHYSPRKVLGKTRR